MLSSPVCEPSLVSLVSGVDHVLILQQMGLVLVGRSSNPFFQLHAVEYATGSSRALVPFNVVSRVVVAPNLIGCVFVSDAGSLFSIVDVVKASSSIPSVSGLEVALADSVQFTGDSLFVAFLTVPDRRLLLSLALQDGSVSPRQLAPAGVSWFLLAADSSFAVYQNATGVFRVDSNRTAPLGSGSTNGESGFLSTESVWLGLTRNGFAEVRLANEGGRVVSRAPASRVLGWMRGNVLIYLDSNSALWGLTVQNTSFRLSDSAVLPSEVVLASGTEWCVFVDSQRLLWIADAMGVRRRAGENVTHFVVDAVSAAFVTWSGGLWRAPFRGDFAVQLVASGAKRAVGLYRQGVLFENTNATVLFASDSVKTVSAVGMAEASWLQGVSVLYRDFQRRLWTACTQPWMVVAAGAVLENVNVAGHLFVNDSSVIPSGTAVAGSAVLGVERCVLRVVAPCLNGSQSLISANLVLGSFASVDSRVCSSCTIVGNPVYSDSTAVVLEINVPLQCSSFSWVVFGVVVGCASLATIVAVISLIVWNKRARKQAAKKLESRELKYRAIERLLPSSQTN